MTSAQNQPSGQASNLQILQYTEPVQDIDTIQNYFFFLKDSLNPLPVDSTYRFELQTIVLPDTQTDSVSNSAEQLRPSLLRTMASRPVDIRPIKHQVHQHDFITVALMFILILLAWSRFFYSRRLKQIFKAFYAPHNLNQLVRDGNLTHERITPGLGFVYISVMATLAYGLFIRYFPIPGIDMHAGLIFLFFIMAITLLWVSKSMFVSITGSLFRVRSFALEFNLTGVIFNIVIGIVAFPLVFAWLYLGEPALLYSVAAIIMIVYVYRFLRLLFIGLKVQSFSVVHFFLYLCTLEILPVLILIKLLNVIGLQ